MEKVCVAIKAHMGWVNAVAVLIDTESPTPLHIRRIDLIDGEDREAAEPYHVAGGWHGLEQSPRPADPAAIIRRGTHRQIEVAKKQLLAYRKNLMELGLDWKLAVVLTGRGWLGDLEHTLGSHAHIHVAEGEAIRSATRLALDAMGTVFINQDEKSILSAVSQQLNCSQQDCDSMMKPLKPADAKSWRREERLIALGAWLNRR